MNIIVEDKITKVRRVVDSADTTKLGPNERAVGTEKSISKVDAKRERQAVTKARIAIMATKLGLPVAGFLKLVRQVGQLNCPYCQLGTQVLAELDRLGDEKAQDILQRVLVAKQNNDHQELARLIEEFKNGIHSA